MKAWGTGALGIGALSALIICSPVLAKSSPVSRAVWVIIPENAPEGRMEVASGGIVFKQKLMPTGVARLGTAYQTPDAKYALSPADELIQLTGSDKTVYCASATRKDSFLKSVLSNSDSEAVRCFSDDDGDGDFDQAFWGSSSVRELPSFVALLPKKPDELIALPYTKVSPSDYGGHYFVAVRYLGRSGLMAKRKFEVIYGAEDHWGRFNDPSLSAGPDDGTPNLMSPLRSQFTVFENKGTSVFISVQRLMPLQPFGVSVMRMTYFM